MGWVREMLRALDQHFSAAKPRCREKEITGMNRWFVNNNRTNSGEFVWDDSELPARSIGWRIYRTMGQNFIGCIVFLTGTKRAGLPLAISSMSRFRTFQCFRPVGSLGCDDCPPAANGILTKLGFDAHTVSVGRIFFGFGFFTNLS